jgi:heme-degrading monooxygenase HmoA
MDHVLAQVNIGQLLAPVDSPLIADFVAAIDPVNALADAAPGFIWRLQTDDGNATALRGFEDEGANVIINMSVWESLADLTAFVFGDALHRAILHRRREWFAKMTAAYAALWWIPRGHVPTIGEAEERVAALRADGPTPYAFTLREHFPAPATVDD